MDNILSKSEIAPLIQAIKHYQYRHDAYSSEDDLFRLSGLFKQNEEINLIEFSSDKLSLLRDVLNENIQYILNYDYKGLDEESASKQQKTLLHPLNELVRKTLNAIKHKRKVFFQVSARAGKLLGRENFSNPEGAIIELVKNSYDADAKNCIVIFDIHPSDLKTNEKKISDKSAIYIIDNGEGMSETIIREHWMKIGTGNKEINSVSKKKRVKTGAKGIGRFALDRLGHISEMWTFPKVKERSITPEALYWKMNWSQFDDDTKSISQIGADLEAFKETPKTLLSNHFKDQESIEFLLNDIPLKHGVIIKISSLKDQWFDDNINNAFKSLEALIPPRELQIPFQVHFQHLQQPNEFGRVETAFFNDYDYKVIAKYDANTLNVNFEITRNELNLDFVKKDYSELFKDKKFPYNLDTLKQQSFTYSKGLDSILKWKLNSDNIRRLKEVGSFNLSFYYLKYSVSRKEGYPYKDINPEERRAVLDKFGGVKVYRDSFRVRPYGDIGNDWLRLGARVAQSPAGGGQRIGDWRVRPEQTAGVITISRTTNPLLIDKSDRGALQENDAFSTFKRIIVGLIHEFEIDRTKILNIFYLHFALQKEKQIQERIEKRAAELAELMILERKKVEAKYDQQSSHQKQNFRQEKEERKSYEEAFKDTFRQIEDEREDKENEELAQIRALASLGLIVASFAHELKEIRDNASEIVSLHKIIIKLIKEGNNPKLFNNAIHIIELLTKDSERIKHWIDYSLTAIKQDKRKRKKINLSTYFIGLEKRWQKVFQERNIRFEIHDNIENVNYNFRAFEMDMSTIFTNLISNSIESFKQLKEVRNRLISIKIDIVNDLIRVIYIDNGIGLSSIFAEKEEIYLPFTTSKKDRKGNDVGTGLGMYLVNGVIKDNNGYAKILEPKIGFAIEINFPTRKNKTK